MFQSYDETVDFSRSAERLHALRAVMASETIDGYLVPRSDEHQSEYIPPSAARLQWLTGFSGSAGVAVVLKDRAAILVDGRYTIQVRSQVDLSVVEPVSSVETPLAQFLETAGAGLRIGFDPWMHTRDEVDTLTKALAEVDGELVAIAGNLVDGIWTDRPAPPRGRAIVHPDRLAGRPAAEKLAAIADATGKAKADATVLTDPSSIAWSFNLRGSDVEHTPLMLAFAFVPAKGRPTIFVDERKLTDDLAAHLEPLADIAAPAELGGFLRAASAGKRIALDRQLAADALFRLVEEGGEAVALADPARLPRAIKTEAEIEGMKAAHRRDGIAVSRFLAWLDRQPAGTITEIAAASKLEELRAATAAAEGSRLVDVSFDTIAGSGPNGAIAHYRVNRTSDRILGEDELFLVDSGAQYADGTTDITRTVAIGTPTGDMRRMFTLVLKSMIALSAARFPKGTRGIDLDPVVRITLWKAGTDYAHGTGHGVGSFLAVHEGPQSISRRGMVELRPGMIISNEPGHYREGEFGIRIENLILTLEAAKIAGGDKPMLGFETITFVPIDRRLIDASLMNADEIAWIDDYHAATRRLVEPSMPEEDLEWLVEATRPLRTQA